MAKNMLNMQQGIKVADWLRKRRQVILDERPAFDDVAKQVAEELKFPVTGSNVRAVAKGCGCTWRARQRRHNGNPMTVIARALARLYVKLGEDVPEALLALVPESVGEENGHK